MKFLQAALLALALVLPAGVAQAGPLEAANAAGQVLDACGTYLPLVARSKQDKWVLIKIAPDPLSGFATPGGSSISGHYTVVQMLGAAVADRSGAYSWPSQSMFSASGSVESIQARQSKWLASSLFSYPDPSNDQPPQNDYLLCVLHEEATGQNRFTDVHLVPAGWEDYVLPAVLFLRSHPQVSGSAPDPAQAQTRALLHGPNPCLAAAAVQQLAARRSLMTADLDAALSSTDQRVAAAALVLVRVYSWADTGADAPANAGWLVSRVAKIDSLDQLEAVAVGVYVGSPPSQGFLSIPTADLPNLPDATTSSPPRRSILDSKVIPTVRQRLKELAPNGGPADPQWRTIDHVCRTFRS